MQLSPIYLRLNVEIPRSQARVVFRTFPIATPNDAEGPVDHNSAVDQRCQMAEKDKDPYTLYKGLHEATHEEPVALLTN